MACYHLLWAAHKVELRRAWHAIIAFGKHKRSNHVGRGMPTSRLGSTHGRTISGMACQHRLWATHTVERRQAWHDITSFGQRTQSNNVGHDIPSPPLENTHGRTKSGVACHHHLWAAHTVELRRAWHAIIAFGKHKRSNDVGSGMTSCLWEAHTVERRWVWYDITAFGLHTRSNDVRSGMTSQPLDVIHGRTSLGVACHHRLWAAQTVG